MIFSALKKCDFILLYYSNDKRNLFQALKSQN